MKQFSYSIDHLAFLVAGYPMMAAKALTIKFNCHFGTNLSEHQVKGTLHRHGIKSGRTGCYAKQHKPWNDGLKGQGVCKANRGTFRKENVPGNVRELGAERICSKDGYVLVKIAEENPYTGSPTRFKAKKTVTWERHNGPVPTGHCIRFRDGNVLNCDIDNLFLVSRAEHIHLTRLGYTDALPEIRPTIEILAKMEVKMFEIVK